MAEKKLKKIGTISHYYGEIGVAVVELSAPIKVGDEIRIIGGEETDFTQPIKSIQVDHKKVEKAKKGESVGLKVKKKVRDGYQVYKV